MGAERDGVGFTGVIHFQPDFPLVELKAQLAAEKLQRAGELFYCDPSREALSTAEEVPTLTFGVLTDVLESEIQNLFRITGIQHVELAQFDTAGAEPVEQAPPPTQAKPKEQPVAKPPPAADQPPTRAAPSKAAAAGNKPTETLRVDIDRLDQLMNLAGQLVINKARFTKISEGLKQLSSNKQTSHVLSNVLGSLTKISAAACTDEDSREKLQAEMETIAGQVRRMQSDLKTVQAEVDRLTEVRSVVNDLSEAVHQLDRVSDEIQKSVMDTRMVPIGPLFGRFRRVIRDITRSTGKDIRLEIRGEKTELDKRMIDELGDPLIHMVRNSADHGIETPDVREAAGKPRQGIVTLEAFHRGNSVVIQVIDDGKGMDADQLRSKAVEKGIITQADAEKLTTQQVYQLIWDPGFTTAEKVTEVSGRGMGMDIVRSKIEGLNGLVELDSEPGRGSRFTIKLPLTMAILPSLLAEIDGDVFAMPVESIIEIVTVTADELSTVHGKSTAAVRGRIVSLTHLSQIFSWNRADDVRAVSDGKDVTLVIIGTEGREIGLAVDRLLGEEDVVIKSMAENYQNVNGIAGASILGDGRVSLILDVAAVVDMASEKTASAAT